MTEYAVHQDWAELNQRYTAAALAEAGHLLAGREQEAASARMLQDELRAIMQAPPALERLVDAFGLSTFERTVLLFCAGRELNADFPGETTGVPFAPTFGLALATLPGAHWSALTPGASLRYWQLLHLGEGSTLAARSLRIDERILHFLAGADHLDEQLEPYVRAMPASEGALVPSHETAVRQVLAAWNQVPALLPIIQLTGSDTSGKRQVAATACSRLGLRLYLLAADVLPAAPADADVLLRLWTREVALNGGALYVDMEGADSDPARQRLAERFVQHAAGPLFAAGTGHVNGGERAVVLCEVARPTRHEQHALWQETLGTAAAPLNGQLDRITAHFSFDRAGIESAAAQALSRTATPAELPLALWNTCREQARPTHLGLAQSIRPVAAWDDLVLPEPQRQMLHDLVAHVRQRVRVYEHWGLGRRSTRGRGITALFAGPSGTGKTMAAEVVAGELGLDLLHVDLSQVVSKYIGETEKNLHHVFEAAEAGGAVLLFDEADALFGKRSEVKDSHDRYANLEISYLLQRMESYQGLAILTTNMKSALDEAFRRRLRFAINFPFPDVGLRAEIWRRTFPPETPTDELDPIKLAQLNATGGTIRNVALYAAFLAADAGEPVRMQHLLTAARRVYATLEQPLTDNEIRGWV